MDPTWHKLKTQIIEPGISSHTGLEVGLSAGQLRLKNSPYDLTAEPTMPEHELQLDQAIWNALPDKGLNYPELNRFVFGKLPDSWLTGIIDTPYVGYAVSDDIRVNSASGGVITQTLLYLLETGSITGAVMLQLGKEQPCEAQPIIARTPEEIQSASGSVYTESSPLTILSQLQHEKEPLAFVGLPDHVAAIRMLQKLNHPSVRAIKYVFGPYTGTVMKFQALASYLKANKAEVADVTQLRYRAGEWPGYLEIYLKDGRVLRAEKFYYNYLIPFFITQRSSQLAVDFTNELTDISVGDAWAPEYETKRGGYSVVLARTLVGKKLLEEMQHKNLVKLTQIAPDKVIEMHSHMIDFKKRGTFIRMQWRAMRGLKNPNFGFQPKHIPASRYFTEIIISGLFLIGSTRFAHWIIEHIPLSIIGPFFNGLRISWKKLSSRNKRKGLTGTKFKIV